MAQARIAPGSRRELGWFTTAFARAAGRVTRTGPPAIFTTLGRRRGLFKAWLIYSAMMMPFGRLARRETELVILRVANLRECEYERRHHERLARRAGLEPGEISRVREDDISAWDPRDRALLSAATQLVQQRDIDHATWAQLRDHLDEADCIELLLLCGHYDALATTLLTLRMQPER